MSIEPALTREEWGAPTAIAPKHKTIVAGGIAYRRHEMAARCLYQQDFGFAHEDIARLESRAASVAGTWTDADDEVAWLHSLADRIAALLPPRGAQGATQDVY